LFPTIFVLKYKTQFAGSRTSEMVHNGSRFWDVVAMDLQKDARVQSILGRRRSGSRLRLVVALGGENKASLLKETLP